MTPLTDPSQHLPTVTFVCVHNAGRSQMAAGFLRELGGDRVQVYSGGTQPAEEINPVAVEAMAEVGIDISGRTTNELSADMLQESDVVVTMGCGDDCPYYPGKRYEDWPLEDPAGKELPDVRPIRDQIKARVEELMQTLGLDTAAAKTTD
ncbi:arsenate reductase ArsC [Nesterenkonia sphaerica]|uniref:Arsenate reductase ArsC n=1 Tax=Nesterenkonia sphaerica TaxID=1804988 RepID=A0A5R9A2A8_9MICC|nr:arsenate reductase ArsC [Nesterenkonia sphaerica]TLP71946.1 arsenate reductase ArsC [Nesterenkonia sphaerica]